MPQQIILGSETASTVSSRGVYKFPVVRQAMKKYDDHQSSSYDVEHCGWSNLPEDDWIWHEDNDGVSENLYGRASIIWANRLLIILIGPAILLCSVSSTWPDCPKTVTICTAVIGTKMKKRCISFLIGHGRGREGEVTPYSLFITIISAEVFINGKSQGKRTKDLTVTAENSADSASIADFKTPENATV